ncbi:uncharacterized protein V6R79_007772 [Siganus canaliculatus]
MHQSVFELIHTEDQQEFRRNLHWALNPPAEPAPPADPCTDAESSSSSLVNYDPDQLPPENSSFLERGFVSRFRCLLDNSSGFLALNIQGRLKFLHGQSRQQCDSEGSAPPQLALFAIATPLQPPAILEIRTRNMIFRTKHKLDFTPMACDAKGKIVLGYSEAELRVRGSGYQFIHAADMLHCAENHVRMMKTGESGLTVFRLLTKDNRWKWVQANARLVYKNGKPDYIIATQRPLVDEEGGEHLRKRSMHLPFTFATGEALLYQTSYPLHGFPDSLPGKAKGSKSKKGKLDKSSGDDLDPKSLLGALMSQDESVYVCQPATEPRTPYPSSLFSGGSYGGGVLNGDGLHFSNGETDTCGVKTSSYDPLLATLDSLTLDGEEPCSNSELFSALENLGLNAEDLELLLLDERMIQVELDPDHIPTLNDLLTNNEILSYIQDTLEETGEEDQGATVPPLTSEPVQSAVQQPQVCPSPAAPPAPPSSRQPLIHLSQQMQQHLSAGTQAKGQPGPAGIPNGHWVHHQHPPRILRPPQPNGEHKHLNSLLESSLHWQLEQDQHPAQLQSHQQSPVLPGLHSQLGPHVPNGHADFTPTVGYDTSSAAEVCHYQQQQQQTQVPAPCLPQSSTLELEQLLGLTQAPLEAYNRFSSGSAGASHSKLDSSCLLSATNAAYIRTCLMPNGNAATAGDVPVPVPCPDALSTVLQDSQKSGFFL